MHQRYCRPVLAIISTILLSTGLAFGQSVEKEPLAVTAVKATPALQKTTAVAGKASSLDRVVEALDVKLPGRFTETRKFAVAERSALNEIVKEQDFGASGNVNPETAAKIGKLTGAKYLLVTSVDNFADETRSEELKIQKEVVQLRTIVLSATARVVDTTTGLVIESPSFSITNSTLVTDSATATIVGNRTDVLLNTIAQEMAAKIANRVASVIHPPTVMDVTGNQVTIDWGDGMFITKGEEWEVCVQKKKKNAVGVEIPIQVMVGKVTITRVDPTASTGKIVGENLGIIEGCVLRRPQ